MLNMLLFFYVPVMLGALLWNTIACLLVFRRRQVVSWRFRYVHYLAMLLMLPGLVCDVGGMFPHTAPLLWAAWLYPTAFFLATLANLGSLRRDGFRWWLVPVPSLNLLLGLIYLTRYLGYLGLPLGLPLDALQVSHAIWAMRQPDMGGGCVFALGDYAEKMGLLNSSGRKRQAYHDYQRLSTAGSK